MYINLHQNPVSIDQSKPCTQSYLQKNRKLHNYATYNSNFKTKLLSDMHHRITYLYINFQQNWVSRSVKTVHTNLFANNRKLHKFATCKCEIIRRLCAKRLHWQSCLLGGSYLFMKYDVFRQNAEFFKEWSLISFKKFS